MFVFVDANVTDQLFQFGHGRQHERHIVAGDPPAGLVIVAMHTAGDMRGGIGLRATAIDGGADIEDDHVLVAEMGFEPFDIHQRLLGRRGRGGEGRAQRQDGGERGGAGLTIEERGENSHGDGSDGARRSIARQIALEIEYFSL